MAIYITQGRYTSDAVKGMVANPENRETAVAVTTEAPQWHQRQRGRIRIRPPALISTATVTLSSPQKSTPFCDEN